MKVSRQDKHRPMTEQKAAGHGSLWKQAPPAHRLSLDSHCKRVLKYSFNVMKCLRGDSFVFIRNLDVVVEVLLLTYFRRHANDTATSRLANSV